MTTPKLIIFDWDGTLADTTQPIIDTMRRSFAECGFPPPEAERVRSLIGYSLPKSSATCSKCRLKPPLPTSRTLIPRITSIPTTAI